MTQEQFYHSRAWKRLSRAFMSSKSYICERCGKPADIAHHKTHITAANITDPEITLNAANLEALCLDCHNSRKDNCPKAVGLAKFADKHHDAFGRIQLIREKTGPDGNKHFYRLDMSKVSIRNKVRGITTNPELDRIFDEDGVLGV